MAIFKSSLVSCCLLFATTTFAAPVTRLPTDSTGLPGDYFNLEGALELFKNANSLEDFEKKLNIEDSYVNNLDLNEDGEVDYIKVNEYVEGNTRAIVIQTPINETESQDIAVIEIEKNGDQSAVIQIVGDEDLYGAERIVEPAEENARTLATPSATTAPHSSAPRVVVNVWAWPTVRYIYAPGYVVYRPAWHWRHYPGYWKPWRPHPYRRYAYYARPYRVNYQVVHVHRVAQAPRIYRPYRTTSVVFKNRYHVTRVNQTRTRTTTHVRTDRTNKRHHTKTNVVKTRTTNSPSRTRSGNRNNRGPR